MATCGVGGWGGPLPGDPDNNSILTASPAFGGIDVMWTFPTTNPHAVAHVKLYRNLFPVFNTAVLLATVSGDRYYDKTNSSTEYFYWIQIVSINGGPPGETIGPASAVGRPIISDVIAGLTGMIDESVLAIALRSDIDSIAANYGELVSEIGDRLAGDAALSLALANVQNGIDEAMGFINTEVTTRIQGDSALVSQIDTMAAVNQSTAALVATETLARVNGDDALATQITDAQVALGEQVAGVEVALIAEIDSIAGEVQSIGALYTAKVTVNGLVGGFGIHNNGTLVDAGFDVDTFWIGRTNGDKRKPFIITDGVVYMDEAVINKLTFSKLRDESGAFIVEDGKVKAQYLTAQSITVKNAAGTIVLQDGVGSFSGALSAATGSFAGSLSAATGTFSGTLTAAAVNAVNTINIAGQAITIPASAFGAGALGLGLGGWTASISVGLTSSGAPIMIFCSGDFDVSASAANETARSVTIHVRLLRNGISLIQKIVVLENLGPGNYISRAFCFAIQDTPGAGGVTYAVQAYREGFSGDSASMSNRTVLALETKR